jgi:hypothetical protein
MDPISARGLASVSLPPDLGTSKSQKADAFQNAMKTAEAKNEPGVHVEKTEKVESPTATAGARVDQFVQGVDADARFIDRQMTRLGRGADLSTSEILQLQGVSYRHAQQVELAAKLVEKVIGGFKQVLNTQV